MRRKVLVPLAVIGLMCGIAVLIFGFTVPVTLSVDTVNDVIYASDELDTDDLVISRMTLFGRKTAVENAKIRLSNANQQITVSDDRFLKTFDLDVKLPVDVTASYDGDVYVGQPVNESKLSLTATYDDGTTHTIKDCWTDKIAVPNVKDKYEIPVYSRLGNTYAEADVIMPVKLSAEYGKEAYVGYYFQPMSVDVILTYEDDSSYHIHDYVINDSKTNNDGTDCSYADLKDHAERLSYPVYLADDVTLYAITPYGVTAFDVKPKDMDYLKASYDDTIYVGDHIDEEKLNITMSADGKSEEKITEFDFRDPGYIQTDSVFRIVTRYGVTMLPISPIKTDTVNISFDEVIEGAAPSVQDIQITYEDGSSKEISPSDVEFLNLPKSWGSDTQTIWFRYHDGEYYSQVVPIPASVAALRNDIAVQATRYKATDDEINELVLICQRIGNKSLAVNADEIAVMLNRYEMYGDGSPDAAKLLEFVENSGYWGSRDSIMTAIENSSVNGDVVYVVRDAVLNGYRSLPVYVDQRILTSEVESSNSGSYNPNTTELISKSGVTMRFYKVNSDDLSVLYCYTPDAYYTVTGDLPATVAAATLSDEDDGSIIIERIDD